MPIYNDSDILITKGGEEIKMELKCGYGQPCVTTIYHKTNDGQTKELHSFTGNKQDFVVAPLSDLKYTQIEIHTTIDDIRDSEVEKLDISLEAKVYDLADNFVDMDFGQKTKGKGAKYHSFYSVSIF